MTPATASTCRDPSPTPTRILSSLAELQPFSASPCRAVLAQASLARTDLLLPFPHIARHCHQQGRQHPACRPASHRRHDCSKLPQWLCTGYRERCIKNLSPGGEQQQGPGKGWRAAALLQRAREANSAELGRLRQGWLGGGYKASSGSRCNLVKLCHTE